MNEEITNLEEAIAQNQLAQGKLSRKIGEAKKQGKEFSGLLQEIKAVSAELKQLQSALKEKRTNISKPETKMEDAIAQQLPCRTAPPSIPAHQNVSIRRALSPQDLQAWDDFVTRMPLACNYHLSSWKQLIEKSFGHTAIYLMAVDSQEQCCGVLPLVELNSFLFGHFLVSLPYVNYGGVLAASVESESALIEYANQYAATKNIKYVEYRDEYQRSSMPGRTDKVSMILPLPDSSELLRSSLTSKLRSQVKRACSTAGLEFRTGGMELLNDFYKVFSINMRDLGTPVYSRQFFRNVIAHQGENSTVACAYYQGKPVSAGILLRFGATVEIPWASTLRSANRLNANMFFYWHVLCFAINSNSDFFDFGRSSKSSGTYKFKQQWGAIEKPLYWHYWLREQEEIPALNPGNSKFKLAINLWRRLPLFVANLIGPLIVKNIP